MSEHNDTWMHIENALMACDLSSWIDLAHGFITHGRLHRFVWSDSPSGYELERILRDRGIHCYGRMCRWYKQAGADGKMIKRLMRWCWVNARQANFAEYNLLGAGVNLESQPVNPANWRNFNRGAARTTWKDRGSVLRSTSLEAVADWLAGFLR